MTERKKSRVSPNQTFFFEQGGSVRLSVNIDSLPFGTLVESFLTERTLWKERKKGDWILYDPMDGKVIPFNTEGKQLGPNFDITDSEKEGKFAGAIVVFRLGLLPTDLEKAKNTLINASYFLKKEGTVFVLESKYQDQDRNWRKQVLKDVGLVKANILVSQDGYLVWEARFHKEQKDRPGFDLTSPADPIRHKRMQKLWKEMLEKYKLQGFVVVNNEPLLSRLKNSKFIPQDISFLKEGLGVSLKARCGCVWEVPFKHNWERLSRCPDRDCDGIPSNPGEIYDLDGVNYAKSKCFDCTDQGTQRQIIYRIEKIRPNDTVRLMEITFCPHCGMGDAVRKQITVLRSQVKMGK